MKFDIFISYRRNGGSERAELLKAIFENKGYSPDRIFMDTHTLKGGDFKMRLNEAINESNNFIVLITKSCFDDIKEGDFFIYEISEAILLNKNVIPVFFDGLSATEMDNVPESIKSLSYKNAVSYSHEYADACYKKLCSFLVSDTKDHNLQESTKRSQGSLFKKLVYLLVAVLVTVIIICGVVFVPINKGNAPSESHQTKEQIIDNIQKSTILLLLSDNSYATAFLISKNGFALTANHVLNAHTLTDTSYAYVNGEYYSIKKIICEIPQQDFTLFQLDTDTDFISFLRLAKKAPVIGKNVYVSSFNFNDGTPRVETGQIESILHEKSVFRTSAILLEGFSGAPMCNEEGEVIGIASAMMENSSIAMDLQSIQSIVDAVK